MRAKVAFILLTVLASSAAIAGSQSSNTSSNSSSNNGRTVQTIDDRYCEDGYCERYVERRVYRDGRRGWRDRERRRRERDDD